MFLRQNTTGSGLSYWKKCSQEEYANTQLYLIFSVVTMFCNCHSTSHVYLVMLGGVNHATQLKWNKNPQLLHPTKLAFSSYAILHLGQVLTSVRSFSSLALNITYADAVKNRLYWGHVNCKTIGVRLVLISSVAIFCEPCKISLTLALSATIFIIADLRVTLDNAAPLHRNVLILFTYHGTYWAVVLLQREYTAEDCHQILYH